MEDPYVGASASLRWSSSSNSSSSDTEDDQTIAKILAEEENVKNHGKLGKMLSHLDSIPVWQIRALFDATNYVYSSCISLWNLPDLCLWYSKLMFLSCADIVGLSRLLKAKGHFPVHQIFLIMVVWEHGFLLFVWIRFMVFKIGCFWALLITFTAKVYRGCIPVLLCINWNTPYKLEIC